MGNIFKRISVCLYICFVGMCGMGWLVLFILYVCMCMYVCVYVCMCNLIRLIVMFMGFVRGIYRCYV